MSDKPRTAKIVAVIPARGGSTRLKHKNIYPLFGKPLIAWSIEAAQRSKYIEQIFISTDDDKIAEVAESYQCIVIPRPAPLADDKTPKMVAVRHADAWIERETGMRPKIIVSLQANSPEMQSKDIDRGIKMLRENKLWEVISINSDGIQNAAIRVIRRSALQNTFLSAHIGVIQTDYVDVHTMHDIAALQARYETAVRFNALKT